MTATERRDPVNPIVRAFPPANPEAISAGFRTSARLGERLSRVALNAADDAADISGAWTKTILSDLEVAVRGRATPADFANALGAFATASVEVATEKLAGFAGIARRVQMETIEVLLDAQAATPAAEPTPAAVSKPAMSAPAPAPAPAAAAAAAKAANPAPAAGTAPKPRQSPSATAGAAARTASKKPATRKAATKPAEVSGAKPAAKRARRPAARKAPKTEG
jgi:hypothetical protein